MVDFNHILDFQRTLNGYADPFDVSRESKGGLTIAGKEVRPRLVVTTDSFKSSCVLRVVLQFLQCFFCVSSVINLRGLRAT